MNRFLTFIIVMAQGCVAYAASVGYSTSTKNTSPTDLNFRGATLLLTGAATFPDNVRQTFNPGATTPGFSVGSIAGDPSAPSDGDMWYDSAANELTARINGVNVSLGSGSGDVTGPASATANAIARYSGTGGKTIKNTGVTIDDSDNVTVPGSVNTGTSGTGQIDIGSAGVRLTDDGDGGLTILGLGNGSDESFKFDLDNVANTVGISSATGVTSWTFTGIGLTYTGGTATSITLATPTVTGAITLPDNTRQTFNPGANAAGLNVGSHAGDPDTLSNADVWYNSSNNKLYARINGATVELGAAGSAFSPSNTIEFYDEFLGEAVQAYPWSQNTSGTAGVAFSQYGAEDVSHQGVYAIKTGTDAAGRQSAYLGRAQFYPGGGEVTFTAIVKIPTLSDGTDEYDFWIGIGDTRDDALQANGISFSYDRNASTNWRLSTAKASSRTHRDLGVAVTAGAWVNLTAVVNADATSVQGYVDGVASGAAITTTIPDTTSNVMSPVMIGIEKSLGTTDRTARIDVVFFRQTLTTPR